ncbi:hypothetical protein Q5752_006918 [Cryptotrichosporon argae]
MSTPSVASLSARLTTTSSLLLERSRILSLSLTPSAASSAQIFRNLAGLRADLARLDEAALERGGLSVGGGSTGGAGRARAKDAESEAGRAIRELGERYDRLVEMLEEDEVGREKARSLKREPRQPSRSPSPAPASPSLPPLAVVPPTPGVDTKHIRPFRDDDDDDDDGQGREPTRAAPDRPRFRDSDDEPELDENGVLAQQQQMMDEQDSRLSLLSHSINRQSHLSVQIGSELDLHHELLEDTDAALDRTAARLQRARGRLDHFAHDARQHGSTITIIVLIVVLLLLIIVFKT